MAIVSVSTDIGIATTLSNGGSDAAGVYVATMTMQGLTSPPTVKAGAPDYQLGVRSYNPPTGVGATVAAAMAAVGYAMALAFQAACCSQGIKQNAMSLMRLEQMIDFATLATTGAYVQAGGT